MVQFLLEIANLSDPFALQGPSLSFLLLVLAPNLADFVHAFDCGRAALPIWTALLTLPRLVVLPLLILGVEGLVLRIRRLHY